MAGQCLSPAQVCDGLADCDGGGGEDEAGALCSARECRHGVLCGETPQCLHSPHRQMCSGQAESCLLTRVIVLLKGIKAGNTVETDLTRSTVTGPPSLAAFF